MLVVIIGLGIFACSRLKREGQEVVNETHEKANRVKEKISDKKDEIVDRVFNTYNSVKPDTDNNKKRFKEHLRVDLTEDIKNIYAYGDFLGADYKVLISFNCDTSTINRIIKKNNMQLKNEADQGLFFGEEFTWWDKKKIEKIKPYKEGKEGEYWHYLWFDRKSKTAYYEVFSL